MHKRFISFFSCLLLIVAVLSLNSNVSVFGSSGSGTVKVAKNSVMTQAVVGITRSCDYSYASVKAISVYPTGNYSKDNYKYCSTQIFHNTIGNTAISNSYKLKEGNDYSKIYLYEGRLSLTKFDLCFAGNNPELDAYVTYSYAGN